jgi:hypothetical protein
MNEFTIYDKLTGEHFNLFQYVEFLENRVKKLEEENVETTNVLYELHNRIDMLCTKP